MLGSKECRGKRGEKDRLDGSEVGNNIISLGWGAGVFIIVGR